MEIIEYNKNYRKDLENLLYSLEEFLMNLDNLKKATIHEEYKKIYINSLLKEIKKKDGHIYLAIQDNKVIGAIVGVLIKYSKIDKTHYNPKKEGEIKELVIHENFRGKNIGTALIHEMEKYFKNCGCDIVRIGAFANNKRAIEFYSKKGYDIRNVDFIKQI